MRWEITAVFTGIRDEYRGWRKFRHSSGTWPIYSMVAGVFSIPALFAVGTYFFIRVLGTGRLPVIYAKLFMGAICGAALWYGFRRLACKIDVAMARQSSESRVSARTLEQFIR